MKIAIALISFIIGFILGVKGTIKVYDDKIDKANTLEELKKWR